MYIVSERSYFAYRWAIPGFTFILIIISLNHHVLIQSIVLQDGVPAFPQIFFGLLALLSGSGIGFLISQIWHFLHESFDLYYGAPRKPYQTTIELYELERGFKKKNDKKRISSFFVYLLNSSSNQKQLTDLLSRRGDLYHLFGSEITSLFSGLLLGWIIRFISHCWLEKPFIFIDQKWWNTTEWNILFITTIITIFFIVLLWVQLHSINKEYNIYADLYIQNNYNKDEKKKLHNIFSREYFYWSLDEINIPKKYEEILNKIDIDSVYKLAKYNLTKNNRKMISNQISKDMLKKWMCKANKFLEKSNIECSRTRTLTV